MRFLLRQMGMPPQYARYSPPEVPAKQPSSTGQPVGSRPAGAVNQQTTPRPANITSERFKWTNNTGSTVPLWRDETGTVFYGNEKMSSVKWTPENGYEMRLPNGGGFVKAKIENGQLVEDKSANKTNVPTPNPSPSPRPPAPAPANNGAQGANEFNKPEQTRQTNTASAVKTILSNAVDGFGNTAQGVINGLNVTELAPKIIKSAAGAAIINFGLEFGAELGKQAINGEFDGQQLALTASRSAAKNAAAAMGGAIGGTVGGVGGAAAAGVGSIPGAAAGGVLGGLIGSHIGGAIWDINNGLLQGKSAAAILGSVVNGWGK